MVEFMRVENWSVRTNAGPYTAPEAITSYLSGEVYGHPGRHHDGKAIDTSRIVAAEGRVVTTRSGSKYTLGEIHPEYLNYLTGEGIKYNHDSPVTIRE